MSDALTDIQPAPGETPFEYYERVYGASGDRYDGLIEYFGLHQGVAKSIALTSRGFNRNFVKGQISSRLKRGKDDYCAFAWLRKKYNLDDPTAREIIDQFKLNGELGAAFEKIDLSARVSEKYRRELRYLEEKYGQAVDVQK